MSEGVEIKEAETIDWKLDMSSFRTIDLDVVHWLVFSFEIRSVLS